MTKPAGADHPPGKRLSYLDGWRGIAILTVLAGHFLLVVPAAGSLGVELFFVLSGRLMAQILIVERYPLPSFFVRRFARIYPALLVMALVLLLGGIAARAAGKASPLPTFADFAAACTFTINYKVALFGGGSALDHTWSISVEEHCYAMLAIVALLCTRRARPAAIVSGTLALAAMLNGLRLYEMMGPYHVHEIYWRTDVRLASVFLSFSIFLATRRAFAGARFLPIPLVAAATVLFFTDVPEPLMFSVGTAALALAVNCLDHVQDSLKRFLSSRWLTVAGIGSYSVYLWQQPFYRALAGRPILVPVMLLVLIPVAWGSFRFVEQPARRRINALWKNRRHQAQPSPA